MEANARPGKKRKISALGQQGDLNTVGDLDKVNQPSNIVVSFHENQTSSVQYLANSPQAPTLNTNSIVPSINYQKTGGAQAFFNTGSMPEIGQIQIFINPQGFGANVANSLENNSGNKTSGYLDSFLPNKQQVLHRIPNLNLPNVQVPKEVAVIMSDEEVVHLNQINNNICPQQKKIITAAKRPRKRTLQCPTQQSEKEMSLRPFDLIYQNSEKIKLPNSTWGYHKNDKDNNIIVFSKARWFTSDACLVPLYERQVVFHKNNQLKIYINNIFSPLETPAPRDIAEMEQILANVDKLSLCLGGPIIEFTPVALLAQKDYAVGRWRHKCCPIIITGDENTCKFCSSINQVLRYPKSNRLPFGRRSRVQKQQVNDVDS